MKNLFTFLWRFSMNINPLVIALRMIALALYTRFQQDEASPQDIRATVLQLTDLILEVADDDNATWSQDKHSCTLTIVTEGITIAALIECYVVDMGWVSFTNGAETIQLSYMVLDEDIQADVTVA